MKIVKIKEFERGIKFVKGEFAGILKPGRHFILPSVNVDIVDVRDIEFKHDKMVFIYKNFILADGLKMVKIKEGQKGLLRINGKLEKFLGAGLHAFWTDFEDVEVELVKVAKMFSHPEIEHMYRNAENFSELSFFDVPDGHRALITINGHFYGVVSTSIFAVWKEENEVEVEVLEVNDVFFNHAKLKDIMKSGTAISLLDLFEVKPGHVAMVYVDGKLVKEAKEGSYAYWRNVASVETKMVDLRERTLEISGQEIMTSDKVTLRVNAIVNYKVTDPAIAVHEFQDYEAGLYKEAQMILRSAIGSKDLDSLLSDKNTLEEIVKASVVAAGNKMGLAVRSMGIKDIILPGEMKDLLNKVTEAKKAAEAALITRREETASMRSQANTAKIMENNPALLKLRELEIMEKFAESGKVTLIAGEKGISDSIRALI